MEKIAKQLSDHEMRISTLETKTAFDDLKKLRLSKKTIAAIAFSLILSVFNFGVRTLSIDICERLYSYAKGVEMIAIESVMRQDFLAIALFLWLVGNIIKTKTEISNDFIPVILFMVSYVLCAVWGFFTSIYTGTTQIADALLYCGLIQGGIVAAIAAFGWDVVNGFVKQKKGGKS